MILVNCDPVLRLVCKTL